MPTIEIVSWEFLTVFSGSIELISLKAVNICYGFWSSVWKRKQWTWGRFITGIRVHQNWSMELFSSSLYTHPEMTSWTNIPCWLKVQTLRVEKFGIIVSQDFSSPSLSFRVEVRWEISAVVWKDCHYHQKKLFFTELATLEAIFLRNWNFISFSGEIP